MVTKLTLRESIYRKWREMEVSIVCSPRERFGTKKETPGVTERHTGEDGAIIKFTKYETVFSRLSESNQLTWSDPPWSWGSCRAACLSPWSLQIFILRFIERRAGHSKGQPSSLCSSCPFRSTTTIYQFVLMITGIFGRIISNKFNIVSSLTSHTAPLSIKIRLEKAQDWLNKRSAAVTVILISLPPLSSILPFILAWRFLRNKWRPNWYNFN